MNERSEIRYLPKGRSKNLRRQRLGLYPAPQRGQKPPAKVVVSPSLSKPRQTPTQRVKMCQDSGLEPRWQASGAPHTYSNDGSTLKTTNSNSNQTLSLRSSVLAPHSNLSHIAIPSSPFQHPSVYNTGALYLGGRSEHHQKLAEFPTIGSQTYFAVVPQRRTWTEEPSRADCILYISHAVREPSPINQFRFHNPELISPRLTNH